MNTDLKREKRVDLDGIKLQEFQQPIRCCNITAIAYALSALGYPTTVDDIFFTTRLPISSVLDDGMTLSETYDACLKYIELANLPLSIRVEHFDKPTMDLDKFILEVERAVVDSKDIHVLNFNAKIAHDNPSLEGGHFSLVANYDPSTKGITIADTNPKRYNRFWECSIEKMYQACVDQDTASNRSRGMIILTKIES